MNYGLPYLGSKSKIAEEIVTLFPVADNFYDLFAGGCAITHALMVKNQDLFHSGFKNYIFNDINDTPELFLDAIKGKYRNEKRWISREDFKNNLLLEKPDAYIKWLWSFGSSGKNYLFSTELEPIKKAFHYIVMFNEWKYFEDLYSYKPLADILLEYGVDNPTKFLDLYKKQYKKGLGRRGHLRVIKWIQKNWINQRYSFSELERLQRLEQLEQDYREIIIKPNSVIYCDIPYKIEGVKDYLHEEFNHKEFWEWAEKQTEPVYVSEYNYIGEHPEKWQVVYAKDKISLRSMKNGKRNINTEKVFWNKLLSPT
jgi:site-specific DNA-adenine methylase